MSGTSVRRCRIRASIEPAGLTGVWAEENTRESIFNAMQRKETFAVSGPHIKVRFFGGWNYAETATAEQRREFWKIVPDWVKDRDWVKAAYAQGVPMGGDLTPMPSGRQGAVIRGVGGQGSHLRQSRPHPDRQGLDQERSELRESLRCRLGG